jgi:two-component system OmpR family sensor kinase
MRRKWPWLIAVIPGLLSIAGAFLLQGGSLPNPLLSIQADVGTLVLFAGLAITGIGLGLLSVHALDQRTLARSLAEEQEKADEACRRFDRRLAEQQERANEAHRRFVGRLDHELGNQLTVIQNGLLNLAGTSSEEESREALATTSGATERMVRLTADLRNLAELKPKEWSSVDVGELLDLALDQARQQSQVENRRLTLTVPEAPWPLPQLRGDPDLLYLAIYNLLSNALKFSTQDDLIQVSASDAGNGVVIQVADTGLGVPDDEIPHLFEELHRGREAKTRGIPGSGLGLALVKAVVEGHGGTVSVRSRAGQGTVFTLSLPTRTDSGPSRG